MAKITLTDLANLQNENTAVNAINNNNAALETAIENTLSRDGTSPNTMSASLDMNSNRIINLPEPLADAEPARLVDLNDAILTVGSGNVVGPASSVDNRVAVFNGTTGKIIKDSGVLYTSLAPLASPTFTGTITAPTLNSTTFTTAALTASGTVNIGPGGTGTGVAQLFMNGGSAVGGGPYIEFRRNAAVKWQWGMKSVTGAATDDFYIYSAPSSTNPIEITALSGVVTLSSSTASSSTSTGALVLSNGGLGVSGSINAGNTIFSRGSQAGLWSDDRALGASRGWTIYATGGDLKIYSQNGTSDRVSIDDTTGDVSIASTTASTGVSTGSLVVGGGIGASGAIFGSTVFGTSGVFAYGAGGTIGYAGGSGVGGTVTQITSRTTGVTLNKSTGSITMFNAAGATAAASFTVTNNTVAATDTIVLNTRSATNKYVMLVTAVGAGSFEITFYTTGGTAADAPVINFAVLKGATT